MGFSFLDKEEIRALLADRPHLLPVFSHVSDIPNRVKEYDPELFIVFNAKKQRYEVHSREAGETTYNATLPYKDLDERTLRYIRKNDIRVHGNAIFERIFRSEERAEKQNEKDRRKFTRDFASEFQSEFAKDAWVN